MRILTVFATGLALAMAASADESIIERIGDLGKGVPITIKAASRLRFHTLTALVGAPV